MPDNKNILILLNDNPSEMQATITRNKKVTFIPADSDQKLTITFTDRVPFSDWETSQQTGDRGKNLKGKVGGDASGRYPYIADCDPGGPSAPGPHANPELIVDGGNFPPPPPPGPKKTHAS
jgi:hypothetical protein